MKIVINECHGGFRLSEDALYFLEHNYDLVLTPENLEFGYADNKLFGLDQTQAGKLDDMLYRSDYRLINVVETLGERANGEVSKLKIIEYSMPSISDLIGDHDGYEFLDK